MLQGDFMKSIEKYAAIFIIGGLGYGLLEMIFRGFLFKMMAKDNLKSAHIHTDILGSDHCPVECVLEF
mgnify:CR=1 FL=1